MRLMRWREGGKGAHERGREGGGGGDLVAGDSTCGKDQVGSRCSWERIPTKTKG